MLRAPLTAKPCTKKAARSPRSFVAAAPDYYRAAFQLRPFLGQLLDLDQALEVIVGYLLAPTTNSAHIDIRSHITMQKAWIVLTE